ncbi:MAG: aminotransferase class I/II-fold pyridoxal phosphate-dependent enzyme, partial [Candidatus Aenigmarchaeota archaeon]|nr:aminotransferase class I/II-fold pyridoxal phosphate-dependent enzyme [Candidatus Aenigmarchaeota archaeon]
DSDPGCRGSYTLTPPEITKAMKTISGQMNLCPNAVTQFEIKWVVEHPEIIDKYVRNVKAEYNLRRQAMVKAFREHLPEAGLHMPPAGFYCFAEISKYTNGRNDTDVLEMLEKKVNVWTLPGSIFAMDPKDGWSRWTYVSETIERIPTGLEKAYEGLSSLKI